MRFQALATDYDGTIARDGVVDDATIVALERLQASGRRLIMVTGRELDDLIRVCPRLDLFNLVVAENGAVLYDPTDKLEAVLSGGAIAGARQPPHGRRGARHFGRPVHHRTLETQ